jgi:hypothetical protein
MKAITTTLYVCGGLMAAATIMGAIDYTSAQRKGTFNKLYKEEKPAVPMNVAEKEIDLEDYSRGAINRPEEKTPIAALQREMVKKETAKSTKQVKKRKKKISYEKFSRAAIPEELVLIDSTVKLK